MKLVYRSGLIVIVLARIAASVGCVSGGRSSRSPQLEDARRKARTVAIVPAAYARKVVYDIHSPDAPLSPGDVLLTAASVIMSVLGLLVKGEGVTRIYNAPPGKLPEEQTATIVAPLRKSIAHQGIMLDDPTISAAFADQVVISAAGLTDSVVSIAREAGPRTGSSELDLSGLSARNVDLAVVVRINDLGFIGMAMPLERKEGEETTQERTADGTSFLPVESDPMASFAISADATVVSVRDGNELLREPLIHFSKPRRISEWVQDPAAVKQEMAKAYASESQRIVENLFLLYDLKPDNISASWEHCVMELREPGMSAHPLNRNKWKEFYVS